MTAPVHHLASMGIVLTFARLQRLTDTGLKEQDAYYRQRAAALRAEERDGRRPTGIATPPTEWASGGALEPCPTT